MRRAQGSRSPARPDRVTYVARFEASDFALVADYAARRDIPFSMALRDLVRIAGKAGTDPEVEPAA